MSGVTGGLGGVVLQALVYGGAVLFVFTKSAKFSLFKPAEEMVGGPTAPGRHMGPCGFNRFCNCRQFQGRLKWRALRSASEPRAASPRSLPACI
jgi:hypothetical protein